MKEIVDRIFICVEDRTDTELVYHYVHDSDYDLESMTSAGDKVYVYLVKRM